MGEPRRGRPRASYNQTGEFDLSLIEEFRSRPALYDRNSRLFKDKVHSHQQWLAISHKLGYDISTLRDRMVQLRNRFNIEKRRLETLREEQNDPSLVSPWPLYDSLDFLGDHIRARRTYRKFYPNPLVSAELNDEYDCSIQEPQIKMEHASETEGSDEGGHHQQQLNNERQQRHQHPLKTFLNGGTTTPSQNNSTIASSTGASASAAATATAANNSNSSSNNNNNNNNNNKVSNNLVQASRPPSKRLAERMQSGKHYFNGRIRVVPETQQSNPLSSAASADDSSDSPSSVIKRKRREYNEKILQSSTGGFNGPRSQLYCTTTNSSFRGRGRGRPPRQIRAGVGVANGVGIGAASVGVGVGVGSGVSAGISAAGMNSGETVDLLYKEDAADDSIEESSSNRKATTTKRHHHIDYENARVYKYQAFGDFIVSSLLELPQKISLNLIQKFTNELVQNLGHCTKDEKPSQRLTLTSSNLSVSNESGDTVQCCAPIGGGGGGGSGGGSGSGNHASNGALQQQMNSSSIITSQI